MYIVRICINIRKSLFVGCPTLLLCDRRFFNVPNILLPNYRLLLLTIQYNLQHTFPTFVNRIILFFSYLTCFPGNARSAWSMCTCSKVTFFIRNYCHIRLWDPKSITLVAQTNYGFRYVNACDIWLGAVQ